MTYDVQLRFNGRTTGAQTWAGVIDADSVHDVLDKVDDIHIGQIVRDNGGSICTTGVTIDARPGT